MRSYLILHFTVPFIFHCLCHKEKMLIITQSSYMIACLPLVYFLYASHLFWNRCVVGGTASGNTWELVKITDARVVLQFTELKSGGKVLHFCLKPSQWCLGSWRCTKLLHLLLSLSFTWNKCYITLDCDLLVSTQLCKSSYETKRQHAECVGH